MYKKRHTPWWTIFSLLTISTWLVGAAVTDAQITPAEGQPANDEASGLPELPEEDDADALRAYLDEVRAYRPRTAEDFVEMHRRIKTAGNRLLDQLEDEESPEYLETRQLLLQTSARMLPHLETEEEKRAELEHIIQYLADREELRVQDVQMAMNTAQALERSEEDVELAQHAYNAFGELLMQSDDPQFRHYGELFQGSARRLALPGNPMELTGITVEGEPFDLKSLEGKVVLVDFWATWCGPCLAEFPNIERNYELYHDRGFEVVAISIDQDRQALEQFLEENEKPWITLHDEENRGQHPATRRYGIFSIPRLILLDQEGKVVSLQARGEELGRLLAELLGPAEEEAES